MSTYKVVFDLSLIKKFIDMLPNEESDDEVYIMSLMARCKDGRLPKVKNSEIHGTRKAVKKKDIIRCLYEYEVPLGLYKRREVAIEQQYISPYITINPRSRSAASRSMCMELTKILIECPHQRIDVVDMATQMLHKSIARKYFLDFDFDGVDVSQKIIDKIKSMDGAKIIMTAGGFHLICPASSVGQDYMEIVNLGCDVHGSRNMIPIPGCYQRDFIPYFYGDI